MITRKELDPDLSMTETRVHPECEGVLVNGVAKLQISMLPPPTKYMRPAAPSKLRRKSCSTRCGMTMPRLMRKKRRVCLVKGSLFVFNEPPQNKRFFYAQTPALQQVKEQTFTAVDRQDSSSSSDSACDKSKKKDRASEV